MRGANADRAIRGYQPLDLRKPRLKGRDHRDGDLTGIASRLAGIGEEVRNGGHIERLEGRPIGVEEVVGF